MKTKILILICINLIIALVIGCSISGDGPDDQELGDMNGTKSVRGKITDGTEIELPDKTNPLFKDRNTSDPVAYVDFDWVEGKYVLLLATSSDLGSSQNPIPSNHNTYPMNATYLYATADLYGRKPFETWWAYGGDDGVVQENDYGWNTDDAKHLWAPELSTYDDYIIYASAYDEPAGIQRIGISYRNDDYPYGDPYGEFEEQAVYFDIKDGSGGTPPNDGFAYDPGVFYDSINQGRYMVYCSDYYSNGRLHLVEMTSDTAGEYLGQIYMNDASGHIDNNTYMEGADIYAFNHSGSELIDTMYYLVFAAKVKDGEQEYIGYCTATPEEFKSDPVGSWHFQGWIMKQVTPYTNGNETFTNQACIAYFEERYYLFYHIYNEFAPGKGRQVCMQQIWLDEDGLIQGVRKGNNPDNSSGYGHSEIWTTNEPYMLIGDRAYGENNRVNLEMYINNSNDDVLTYSPTPALENFKTRYYFNVENNKTPVLTDINTPHCSASLEQVSGSLWAVVLDFNGFTLEPGHAVPEAGDPIAFELKYSDGSFFDKSNDFSQPGTEGFGNSTNIGFFDSNNEIVAGNIPEEGTYSNNLRSPWWGGQMLTATNLDHPDGGIVVKMQDVHQEWNTQDWIIEPVEGTDRVRIYNVGKDQYLTIKNENERSAVVCQPLNTSWSSQEWYIEEVPGEDTVRFKNAYGGHYLTVQNTGDWQDLWCQSLHTDWISQKWIIE
jgi:hypothetical protein